MDELDFRIIAELVRAPFASHATIGRALRLTGTAVKSRLDEMEDRSVISGYLVVPSAASLRRVQKLYPFHAVEPEPRLDDILEVDNVVAVARADPGTLIVDTFTKDGGVDPPPELVKVIHGTPERATLTDAPQETHVAVSTVSPLDWRVVEALLDGPRASLRELATKARLTPTTVRRRRDSLLERGLLRVSPIVDTRREPGLLVYSGYVWLSDPAAAKGIRSPGLASIWVHHEPPAASIFGACPNFAAVEQFQRELRSLPGVVRAELTAARGGIVARDRLRGWIRDELAWWSGPRDGARLGG
ncbi:MAG TPA: AsnC family transcriptional regulator [Thermoplasmata archaeon]|nr:AsnC family transcriptional regulator [Thermoplasmata archaeon]